MSVPPNSTTFRDMVAAISPSWLQGFVGLRFMYSMAIQFDAIADAAAYSVRARFPDLAPFDAFPYLANDRQIDQGFAEPLTYYAVRLTQWLDRWAHAGSPFGLLMAVRGYVSPDLPEVATVNNAGVWDYYPRDVQDGPLVPPTHSYQPGVVGWNWDSLSWPYLASYGWWRVWVIIWGAGSPWTASTQAYDDGSVYDGGEEYDWSGTTSQADGIRAIVKKWKSAGTSVPWILIAFDAQDYQPDGTGVQPDGTWGTWATTVSVGGRTRYVAARDHNTAFLAGVD